MITVNRQRSWLQQLLKQVDHNLENDNQPSIMRAREAAIQAIDKLPALNRQQEAWRYTSIEDLLKYRFEIPTDMANMPQQDIENFLLSNFAAYRLVVFNGKYLPQHSNKEDLPEGVSIDSLRVALMNSSEVCSAWFGRNANHNEHVFTALNTALTNDGVLISIDAGVHLDRPIELIYINHAQTHPILIQPRNLVVLGNSSKATLIERFVGLGNISYFHNNVTEISVGKDAALGHYRIQNENLSAYHLSSLNLSLEEYSKYRGTTLTFGSIWARTEYETTLKQHGAECILNGLYVVGNKQLADFHLNIRHSAPGCISREQFKGILYGKGHAVFDGRILVDRNAQQTDAQLTNDNLMLTREAEVDTKPQLEIYADDVKCSHGTTVGQLDQQQIFYMRSRGINEDVTRKMLCLGFASEIIDTINIPVLHTYCIDKLAEKLSSNVNMQR